MILNKLFSPKGLSKASSGSEISERCATSGVVIQEVHKPIDINTNLSARSLVKNVHGDIVIKNCSTEGAEISNTHGNVLINGDAVSSTRIKSISGGVSILAPESVCNVFTETVHGHNGIASPEIISVTMDATHGTAALKAITLKDIDISSVHNPVVIDARQLQKLENVSVSTTHGDLLVVFDPQREQETREFVSQIKFQSVHGRIAMIPKEPDVGFEAIGVDETSYQQTKALPSQPLRLEHPDNPFN